MTAAEIVSRVGDFVLLACIVPSYLLMWYLTRVPWWKSVLGRGLMGLKFSLAAILTLALVRVVFGAEGLWFEVVRLIVFLMAFAALATQAKAFRQILIRAVVLDADTTSTHRRSHHEDRPT